MKKFFVKTFGCQMNQADSEKINMIMMQSGFIRAKEMLEADIVFFNTCSVRQKGEDRVFGFINEVDKENKRLKEAGINKQILVSVTGCMTRKTGINKKYLSEDLGRNNTKTIELLNGVSGIYNYDDELFIRNENIDFVFRIEEVSYITKILSHIIGEHIGSDDKFDDYLKMAQTRDNNACANVIIQTGCDNYCTYCIVPFTRGGEISRPISEILEEVEKNAKEGVREITLLGQNVNSYGKQFNLKYWNKDKSKWNEGLGKSPFRELLEGIEKIEGIDRVRFTSSNPHDMTNDILDAHFDIKSTCNYLHFALQSGSNEMLKKMNRRHSYDDFKSQAMYLRSKDPYFSISTDIIVGYSGETEEMFQETVKAMEEIEFDFVYIARYSVRQGTLGAKMYPDDISPEEKARRWNILNGVLEKTVKKRNEMMLGREEEILITKISGDIAKGRTRNFKEVSIDSENIKLGDIVKIKILGLEHWILKGERV